MMLRISEIITFPNPKTNNTDIDITIDALSCAVIASALQIPSTCIVIGLSSDNGSNINFWSFFDSNPIIISFFEYEEHIT